MRFNPSFLFPGCLLVGATWKRIGDLVLLLFKWWVFLSLTKVKPIKSNSFCCCPQQSPWCAHTSASEEFNHMHVCFDGTIKKRACHNVTERYKISWNYLCCDVLGGFLLSNKKSQIVVAYKRCNRILDVFWAMQTKHPPVNAS